VARHSRRRDAQAIAHHYDVSNRFYELVLGPSMTYSCGVWASPEISLEEAQAAKYELICRKLGLLDGMRLLDVGCGWGGMAMHAARHHGVRSA
jgi:cyclopropane-fatty-acyl-phospholipid synthase